MAMVLVAVYEVDVDVEVRVAQYNKNFGSLWFCFSPPSSRSSNSSSSILLFRDGLMLSGASWTSSLMMSLFLFLFVQAAKVVPEDLKQMVLVLKVEVVVEEEM